MIFTVAVHGAPYASFANHHALGFCESLLQQGHQLNRVFFYHEGVLAGLNSRVVPQDEVDVVQRWLELKEQYAFELAICIANALKRGVINESEQKRYNKPAATLQSEFELVGLGQLIDAIAHSDRYIEFPA
ncbi:MAG: sulfurtransferase complex subunit TusD [Pseudomonadales bacterium]|jgi:tRNA 2-thiouridine synthesizing protein D|nr:sulfurtransferase complex subunit TusD [Pseudomonadales bacterium]